MMEWDAGGSLYICIRQNSVKRIKQKKLEMKEDAEVILFGGNSQVAFLGLDQ